jgi:hypothetical protein
VAACVFVLARDAFRERLLELLPVYGATGRTIAKLPAGEPLPDKSAAFALCDLAARCWLAAALESSSPSLTTGVVDLPLIENTQTAEHAAVAMDDVRGAVRSEDRDAAELAMHARQACEAAADGRWAQAAGHAADALYARIDAGTDYIVTEARAALETTAQPSTRCDPA